VYKRQADELLSVSEKLSEETGRNVRLRIGIATGPITAGVIGKTKFAYDVWATTVNIASRLQSSGDLGRIHISNATRIAVRDICHLVKAPKKSLKGLSAEQTWYVEEITG